MQEKYHLRSLWRYVMLVTVRRWQRSVAGEGRWGSLTKCGVTECVTDRRRLDGPSCWFIMKIREVVIVPKFQEFKCYGMETLDRLFCLWRSLIPSVEGNEESIRRICTSMGKWSPWRPVVTTMTYREVRRSSRILTDFQLIESLFN